MRSVGIIDGFAEGKWNTLIFRKALVKAGFSVTDEIEEAEIIIAHSAGCFFLPKTTNQLILLIGPPHWPGKSLAQSFLQKVAYDFQAQKTKRRLGYWFKKSGWNIIYTVTDLMRVFYISTYTRMQRLPEIVTDRNVHLIRNESDAWCSPDIANLIGLKPSHYHELPGEHDDCWTNPEPYIKLLNELVKAKNG